MGYLKTRMMINEMRRNFYVGRRPGNRNIDHPEREVALQEKIRKMGSVVETKGGRAA